MYIFQLYTCNNIYPFNILSASLIFFFLFVIVCIKKKKHPKGNNISHIYVCSVFYTVNFTFTYIIYERFSFIIYKKNLLLIKIRSLLH